MVTLGLYLFHLHSKHCFQSGPSKSSTNPINTLPLMAPLHPGLCDRSTISVVNSICHCYFFPKASTFILLSKLSKSRREVTRYHGSQHSCWYHIRRAFWSLFIILISLSPDYYSHTKYITHNLRTACFLLLRCCIYTTKLSALWRVFSFWGPVQTQSLILLSLQDFHLEHLDHLGLPGGGHKGPRYYLGFFLELRIFILTWIKVWLILCLNLPGGWNSQVWACIWSHSVVKHFIFWNLLTSIALENYLADGCMQWTMKLAHILWNCLLAFALCYLFFQNVVSCTHAYIQWCEK